MGEVEIEIGVDGKVLVRTNGVKGKRCLEYAEYLRELVGREEQKSLTAEYYEPEAQVRFQVHRKNQAR
ncbi:MAG: DUF2997 domain-containing protein [Planctomycetota bacterium]